MAEAKAKAKAEANYGVKRRPALQVEVKNEDSSAPFHLLPRQCGRMGETNECRRFPRPTSFQRSRLEDDDGLAGCSSTEKLGGCLAGQGQDRPSVKDDEQCLCTRQASMRNADDHLPRAIEDDVQWQQF